jgi:hypothetical protein
MQYKEQLPSGNGILSMVIDWSPKRLKLDCFVCRMRNDRLVNDNSEIRNNRM